MSVVETVLIFVGIPVLIFAVLAALTIGRGGGTTGRFSMGKPWEGQPLWFVGHPRPNDSHDTVSVNDSAQTVKGGASGSW